MKTVTLPVTEIRKKLLSAIDEADATFSRFVITKNGVPKAVMLSYDEFMGLLETLDILSNPDEVKKIQQGLKAAERGEVVSFEEVFGKPLPKKRRK